MQPPAYAVSYRAPSIWRSLDGLRTAIGWLLAAASLIAVWGVVAHANRLAAIDDLASSTAVGARADDANRMINVVTVVLGVVMVAILACFIVWLWRAAKNNDALGRDDPRLGPEWAIAGWFIPLANLAIPVLVVQDVWRGSNTSIARGDPRWRIADRSALVGWWWATLIVALVWVGSGNGTDARTASASQLRTQDGLAIVGMLAVIACAVLALLLTREIGRRQQATLAAQQEAWRTHIEQVSRGAATRP